MCDFHQWGYLKGNVYRGKPQTLEELKTAVQNQIGGVNKDILKTADAYLQTFFLNSPCEYNNNGILLSLSVY